MNIRKLLTRLVSLALIAVFLPTVAMADTWYLEDGSITEREIKLALRNLDSLLQVIYSGGPPEMIHFMEEKV